MKMEFLQIEIRSVGSAIESARGEETARILKKLEYKIEEKDWPEVGKDNYWWLFDNNGNSIGDVTTKKRKV